MDLRIKLLSSLIKVFPEPEEPGLREFTKGIALAGEVFAFQVAYYSNTTINEILLKINSRLKEHITVRKAGLVPAEYLAPDFDDSMLRVTPGLFPDPLLSCTEKVKTFPLQWRSLWISAKIPENCPEGKYPITIEFSQAEQKIHKEVQFELTVLPAVLPEQTLMHTEWFHADCLARQYNVDVWSEAHWTLLGKYFRNMAEHGINLLLTPLFTLPLDTKEGGERPTSQLVDVYLETGKYRFDFQRLESWIKLAQECGIHYFEMSHLFTQWGGKYTPKIIVDCDGVKEKKFGWHVKSLSEEYISLLEAFLPELLVFLNKAGIRQKCYFHISDEPHLEDLQHYKEIADLVKKYIPEDCIWDAVSNVEFYKQKICKNPIPSISELVPFLEQGIKNLWTYYCCGPWENAPNRFFNMPLARTRSIGLILYKYDLSGFLHWGYNFWFSRYSLKNIDPFKTTDADGEFPAGDPFLVYPGENGPIDSIRFEALREGFQDYRTLKLVEKFLGRKDTLKLIESAMGYEISDKNYPKNEEDFLLLRKVIYKKIELETTNNIVL